MTNLLPERIIQFGTGRLLRGFADFFIHKANEQGLFDGGVVCIQSTGTERANTLNTQQGRFTLWTRGIEEGEKVDRLEIIESISRVIPANEDWVGVLKCARNPEFEIVVSNASEVAVVLDEADRIDADPPRSFPGKVTALLYQRAREFDFAEDAGLVILPCELLENNGDELKRIVLELAEIWDLGSAFVDWIESANVFCNTLVDRIVTGRPSDEDLASVRPRLGFEDQMVTVTEPYRLWAIEGPPGLDKRLEFVAADPGIVIAADITPYRERKLRLLNGGHTLTVPLGILLGNDTVLDNMEHPDTGPFIEALLREEIGPTVPVDQATVEPYIDEVLDRWRNPFLNHKLLDIAWQSTSKMKHRVVPSILRYYERFGAVPKRMARGFAAYLILTRPEYDLQDDHGAIPRGVWADVGGTGAASIREVVDRVSANESLWGVNLSALDGFCRVVAAHVREIMGLS